MATRSLGALTLDLIARIGGFEQGINRAARITDQRMKHISDSATKAGKLVGAGLAAGVTAMTAIAASAMRSAAEISNLSAIANVSTTDFQRWSAGAKAVGIEQDKLADILKDVNDKVGDYLNTGGGGMIDFFEQIAPKVGVTADEFRNLSGSQALGLYVSSLEKAKVSQSDMTFYLEAIASDATALLPLLRNNAEGFQRFGDAAAAAGAIMDEKTIRAGQELRAANWLIEQSVSGLSNQLTSALLPTLANFATRLNDATINGVMAKKVSDDLAASFQALGKFAVGTVGGIHMLGYGLKTLSDLDNAMVGGEEASWWDRYLPPVRVYNAFKNSGEMGKTLSDARAHMADLAQGYGDLMKGFDQKPGEGATNQVKELASLMEQMRSGGAGSFNAVTPGQQQEAKQLESTLKTAASGFAQLKQQYDPAGAAVDDFKEKTAQLGLLMKNGKISQQEYAQGTEWVARGFNDAIQASSGLVEQMKYQAELEKGLANQKAQYQLAADSIGMGSKEAGRYQERLQLEQENNDKILGLRTELATTSDALRRRDLENQIALIEEYQPEQLEAMQEGWALIDEAQSDWMKGMAGAWADYADAAMNYAAMASDATSTVLGSARSELGSFLSDVATGSADVGDALGDMVAGFGKAMIDTLADMAAQWLVYQAVQLLVGKSTQSMAGMGLVANAQATAFQAQLAAYASTAAIPVYGPALAPAAAFTAAAATAPMVAGVASSALMGMAHDGMDNIPREGTWLLDGGERVLNPNQNRDLTQYLRNAGDAGSGAGRSGGITINAPITVQAQSGMSDEAARRQAGAISEAVTEQIRDVIHRETQQGGLLWRRT
ncbi:phage tail tape measure C-terminal domain-containing protein [Pseudomonas sp. Marseille-P9899]|uniref:phage tail tape measure C-terminal domain-containing protein n=1 Tax=Pseudomonas sp. Marseille-P9899 TaxID=2730401 RepID=UPI00158906DE|nr:phage tail tape measure C-terminal domain-containing protein [Pseudomonas sp. Marseille-P9899]